MITINKTLAWTPGPIIHLALVVQQPADRMKEAQIQQSIVHHGEDHEQKKVDIQFGRYHCDWGTVILSV